MLCAQQDTFWWIMVGGLALLYVIATVRIAMSARRLGRNPVAWFVISLLFTALPAMIVFHGDHANAQRTAAKRAARDRKAKRPGPRQ